MPAHFLRRLITGTTLVALMSTLGAGCTNAPSADVVAGSKPVTLTVWAVNDDGNVYDKAMADFRVAHPNVTFDYHRMRLEEYEADLLNALAEDRGPDIFMIHNDWVGKYMSKITPLPAVTHVAYSTISGSLSKSQVWELRDDPTITNQRFKNQYADVVVNDLLRTVNLSTTDQANYQLRPMGIPVDVDTLALYYNKDLMNAANLPNPPEFWDQFQEQVKKLTKVDQAGNILQSGAAIGTSKNVERYADIMAVLMMQNGAQMLNDDGSVAFQNIPAELSGLRESPPSYQALQFYTDFANLTKETYTWNASMPNSLDAFIQGQTAFFLGYSYHLPQIRARAPKLNFGLSPLPQISGNPVRNFANYWSWSVSKKSAHQDWAWNFLNTLTDPTEAQNVLTVNKRPAAIKSLLTSQLNDEDVGVFANQVLTAKSWYRGSNPQIVDDAFATMIDSVVNGAVTVPQAVSFAADTIDQTR